MINEEKVILMTKMAAYETGKGKKDMAVAGYFRSDYIGFQLVKSWLSATIVFLIVCVLYVVYDYEALMSQIYTLEPIAAGKGLIGWYAATVGIYMVVSYIIAVRRYWKAAKNVKKFTEELGELEEEE